MLLDTINNAQNKRGRIRQVALDKGSHPRPGYLFPFWRFSDKIIVWRPFSLPRSCIRKSRCRYEQHDRWEMLERALETLAGAREGGAPDAGGTRPPPKTLKGTNGVSTNGVTATFTDFPNLSKSITFAADADRPCHRYRYVGKVVTFWLSRNIGCFTRDMPLREHLRRKLIRRDYTILQYLIEILFFTCGADEGS